MLGNESYNTLCIKKEIDNSENNLLRILYRKFTSNDYLYPEGVIFILNTVNFTPI